MSKVNIHKGRSIGYGGCEIDKSYVGSLDRHHIKGRKVHNWDGDWNVVYVSPNIHRAIHDGRLEIEGWFQTSTGRELLYHVVGDASVSGINGSSGVHIIRR
jgi:hypothetical protein